MAEDRQHQPFAQPQQPSSPQSQEPQQGGEPELVVIQGPGSREGDGQGESVEQPAKVMRIGAMTKQLLDEVRRAPLDDASRARLREVYETSVRELAEVLSPNLREELDRLALPFSDDEVPTEAELRVAHAQLVGWLEGLFHGIQATLFAQQMAAQAQLAELQRRGLPRGDEREGMPNRPGTYL